MRKRISSKIKHLFLLYFMALLTTILATNWLRANGKKGILGEFAGGANSQCASAITDMLTYMGTNSDVWTGALWWGK